jgi:hypothetical protein
MPNARLVDFLESKLTDRGLCSDSFILTTEIGF